MPKMYKATNARETMCKDAYENEYAQRTNKTCKSYTFFLVDTDELQKQVNRLENEVNHMRRIEARRRWRRK